MRIVRAAAELTDAEKLLLGEIAALDAKDHEGGCYASSETLAWRLASSVSSIDRYRTRLTRAGLLARKRGFQKTRWFVTLPADVLAAGETPTDTAVRRLAAALDASVRAAGERRPRRGFEAHGRTGEHRGPEHVGEVAKRVIPATVEGIANSKPNTRSAEGSNPRTTADDNPAATDDAYKVEDGNCRTEQQDGAAVRRSPSLSEGQLRSPITRENGDDHGPSDRLRENGHRGASAANGDRSQAAIARMRAWDNGVKG